LRKGFPYREPDPDRGQAEKVGKTGRNPEMKKRSPSEERRYTKFAIAPCSLSARMVRCLETRVSNELVKITEDSARGGFFLFAGNALSLLTLAISSIIVARLLGPENYGLFSLSLVVPSILAGLMDLGVNPALTRFSAKLRIEGKGQLAAARAQARLLYLMPLNIDSALVV